MPTTVNTTVRTGAYVEMVMGSPSYGTTSVWTTYFMKMQTFIADNYVTYHAVAQVTGDTGATFRLERIDGVGGGTTYDLLRWNTTAYTVLRKNVELYEALCYLEYVRLNGHEFLGSEIEAFNIDTVMAVV